MKNLGVVLVGVTIVATVMACVGDSTPSTQGQLNGPCFADNACNTGLTCNLVNGAGQCVASGSDASTNDGSTADAADSGPRVCTFQPTFFPCGGQNPPFACYGAAQSCTATGCSGQTDVQWQCFSPNQCNSPCCVSASDATLAGGANCTQGTLVLTAPDAGGGNGSVCSAGAACPSGHKQLCKANSQCPTGQVCNPVKITGGGLAMNGVVVGACVPE